MDAQQLADPYAVAVILMAVFSAFSLAVGLNERCMKDDYRRHIARLEAELVNARTQPLPAPPAKEE